MSWWPTREQIERLERRRWWPCDNCGRRHYGAYDIYVDHEYGGQVDFDWLNFDGTVKKCVACNNRRGPCVPFWCYACSAPPTLPQRRQEPLKIIQRVDPREIGGGLILSDIFDKVRTCEQAKGLDT